MVLETTWGFENGSCHLRIYVSNTSTAASVVTYTVLYPVPYREYIHVYLYVFVVVVNWMLAAS